MESKTKTQFLNQIQPLCENLFSFLLYSLWQLPLQGVLFGLARTRNRFFIPRTIAPAFKAVHAGIVALVSSFTASRRIYVGLGLMMVVAPVSYYSFMLFDRGHHIRLAGIDMCNWYHHNYWHLLFLIRYQVAGLVFLLGLYLVLSKNPFAKFISLYMGFILMGLILNVTAKSNSDIWDTMDVTLFAACIAFCLTALFLIDWLTHRYFHRKLAFDARLELIYENGDEFGSEKAWSMFKTTWREKKAFEKS